MLMYILLCSLDYNHNILLRHGLNITTSSRSLAHSVNGITGRDHQHLLTSPGICPWVDPWTGPTGLLERKQMLSCRL